MLLELFAPKKTTESNKSANTDLQISTGQQGSLLFVCGLVNLMLVTLDLVHYQICI